MASLIVDLVCFGFLCNVWVQVPDVFAALATKLPMGMSVALAWALLIAPGVGMFACCRMSRNRDAAIDRMLATQWHLPT